MQHTQGKLIVSKGVGLRKPQTMAIVPYKKRYTKRTPMYKKVEFKLIDTASFTQVIDSTGQVNPISLLNQGTDYTQRVGRSIKMKSLEFKAKAYATPATGIRQQCCVMLVLDQDVDGGVGIIAGMLTAVNPLSPRNLTFRDRYICLKRWNFTVYPDTMANNTKTLDYYKRINITELFNSGNAATIADVQKGAIYVVSLGDVVAGATAGSLTYTARIRFTDD